MENTLENVATVQGAKATQEIVETQELSTIQGFTDAQKKAMKEYELINAVVLRGDWNEDDNKRDKASKTYTIGKDGKYEQEFIKVDLFLADSDDTAIKVSITPERLEAYGVTRVEELSGKYCKVIGMLPIEEGDELPFKVGGETVQSTASFIYAEDINVLTDRALAMKLRMA